MIDAKSATKLIVDKLAELQHEVKRAAQANAVLVNAKLVDPDVRSTPAAATVHSSRDPPNQEYYF